MGSSPGRPTQKIPQKRDFSYRTAHMKFEWAGMRPDGDPASDPDNTPAMVINGRFRSGSIRNRFGQANITIAAIDVAACIYPFDFPIATPKTIFSLADGCPGQSNTVGGSTSFFDWETSPQFQPGIYYNTTTRDLAVALFAGDLYLGTDLAFRKYTQIQAPRGQTGLSISGSQQDLPIFVFDPTEFTGFLRMAPFDGFLFLAMESPTPGSTIMMAYDGIGLFNDNQTFASLLARDVVQFRDTLAVLLKGATGAFGIRQRGVAGTYATFGTTEDPFRGVSYRDILYATSLGENLFSFDGTTVTTIPIATTGIAAGAITYGIAVVGDFLYVSWTDTGGANNAAKIARFDGFTNTWTGTIKDITAEFPAARDARPLLAYRGGLALGATDVGFARIYLSRNEANIPSVVSGDWRAQDTSIAGLAGDIYDLAEY